MWLDRRWPLGWAEARLPRNQAQLLGPGWGSELQAQNCGPSTQSCRSKLRQLLQTPGSGADPEGNRPQGQGTPGDISRAYGHLSGVRVCFCRAVPERAGPDGYPKPLLSVLTTLAWELLP